PSERGARYVRSDELHQTFNFDFLIAEWNATTLKSAIEKTLLEVTTVGAPPTWVLCNHDSPRVVTRFGGGEIGARKARAMALLIHALPGGIYIYQGEELGLEDAPLPDEARQDPVYFRTGGADKGRDGARVPLPWNSERSFGFTTGTAWLPMPDSWRGKEVVIQQKDQRSFLSMYQESLRIRSQHPALQQAVHHVVSQALTWIDSPEGVLAFRRDPGFILIANITDESQSLTISGELLLASSPEVLVAGDLFTIPAHTTCWISAR
ncbi:MAG: alpha-amylase family glycosyl hydrolase, partial [Planctomycetia bacterium]